MGKEQGDGNAKRLTVVQWRRKSIICSQLCSFLFLFSAGFVYYTECVNWGVRTSSNHSSIPHEGENCMCEESNNSMHCFYSNEADDTGHTTRLIHIMRIMRDFTHF